MSLDNLVSFPANGSARPLGDACAEFCARWRGSDVGEGARLLRSVLPPRVPGALQLVIARALGELDVPPFASPDEFRAAVRRFAEPPAELADISDVRRARRRSRVTLDRIALETAVPPHLIRQLEWGDFRGWHHAEWTKRVCHAYARAAGLDPERVHAIVEDERSRQHAQAAPVAPAAARDSRRQSVGFATAAAAVFAAGLLVGGLIVSRDAAPQRVDAVTATAEPAAQQRSTQHAAAPAADTQEFPTPSEEPRAASDGTQDRSTPAADDHARAANESTPPEAPTEGERTPAGSAEREPTRAASAEGDRTSPASAVGHRDPAAPAVSDGALARAGGLERPEAQANPRSARREENSPEAGGDAARSSVPPASNSGVRQTHAASVTGPASFSPAFSSAGSAVFYHRDEGAGSALMKADTDAATGDLRIVSLVQDGARNYHVKPSPDGSRIAFDSDRDGERGVYIANADGSGVQRVSGPGFAAVPSWSPDGTRLAFVRGEPQKNARVWNLWVLDLDSNTSVKLTSHRYGQPWGASWFPDGRRLAYSHEDRLTVLDLTTGSRRVFRSPRAGRLVRTPAVSPDGRHVVFQVYRDGAWLLNLNDGSMQRILADPTAEEFAWDASGRRLAFHSRRSGQWSVWIMADPSGPTS